MTLATVAEALGVSAMTVSNAYNRPEKLSPELRERMLAVAEELGYPGPHAHGALAAAGEDGRAGRGARRDAALRVRGPRGARVAARARAAPGIALHLVPATGGEGDPALVLEAAVDAFVIFALPDGHPLVEALLRRGLPMVVQGGPELHGYPLVGIDERAAAAAAARAPAGARPPRLAVLSLPFAPADAPTAAAAPTCPPTASPAAGSRATAWRVGREAEFNDRAHGEAAAGALLDGPSRRPACCA